ncbi:ABC transporter substrate-binding protein [Halobaculum sp. EA56]|uniref:ABC transporter substrate-binding protein n=1 Tax=Halobaculum sp. EA56 TaxID=3421648 RepID=UPI003EBB3FB1
MKYGGAVVGGGLLAGCAGQSDTGASPESTSTETSTDNGSYTVEMFPVGEVEFEDVPETWMATNRNGWADMAAALGQVNGNRSSTLYRNQMWYDLLGIEYNSDWPEIYRDGSLSKEVFYELDCDVHFLDPNNLVETNDWDESDVEEIEENIGPFFAAFIRAVNASWQRDLGYPEEAPTMLEALKKLGQVFQQPERAQAMLDLHEEVQSTVDSRLEGIEPVEIGAVYPTMIEGKFRVLNPVGGGGGYGYKHHRDLEVVDAFAEQMPENGFFDTDYEGLLEVDPDNLVVVNGIANWETDWRWDQEWFMETWIEQLENHPVGQELTAVQNGNIHPGGVSEQGPIINLFQLEFTAQQLYPEQFGEFTFETYPEVPEENQLFDRQRVRDIINGDI